MDWLPQADGTTRHYDIEPRAYVPKRKLCFGDRVKTLVPYLDQYVFFTVAPLYLWGRFDECVLVDFISGLRRPVDFLHHKFSRPVFRGLEAPNGNVDWNFVLWAIEKPHYRALEDHLLAAMLTDTPRQTIFRYGVQELIVLDPLYADRQVIWGAEVPSVPILAFGVSCNRYQAAFEPGDPLVLTPPRLVFYEPDDQSTLYANAVFTHKDPKLIAHFRETLRKFEEGKPQWKSN